MVHRIRERGTSEKLFELFDERTMGLSEIVKFMEFFFREPDEQPFPRHPAKLLKLAKDINVRSARVYDGRLDKMVPPLNLKKLGAALGPTTLQCMTRGMRSTGK